MSPGNTGDDGIDSRISLAFLDGDLRSDIARTDHLRRDALSSRASSLPVRSQSDSSENNRSRDGVSRWVFFGRWHIVGGDSQ